MNQHLNILRDPKYKSDEVFQAINRIYLTLKDDEARRNSEILKEVFFKLLIFTVSSGIKVSSDGSGKIIQEIVKYKENSLK